MMARAIIPRAPANRNDLSEDKLLHPEQSGHLSFPRSSVKPPIFRLFRATGGIGILIGLCSLVQPIVGFPLRRGQVLTITDLQGKQGGIFYATRAKTQRSAITLPIQSGKPAL